MKRKNVLISLQLIVGLIFVFISSCAKEDDVKTEGIPVLSTSDVTNIFQQTAQSGGTITSDEGFLVIARGVCWSTEGNPTVADHKTSDGTGAGSFTSDITDLTPGTTYYIRAYASSSKGTGYGSTLVFQTIGSSFTDTRDSNVYQIVTIGNQIWMAENLRYLPDVVGPAAASNVIPYYYVFDYNGTDINVAKATDNYSIYGVLYNWPAAMAGSAGSDNNPGGVQGVCPPGWHIPDDAEWTELTESLGGASLAGGKLKETGTSHWNTPNTLATDESGFTAIPGGGRGSNGIFTGLGHYGNWWSATEQNSSIAWGRVMSYNNSNVSRSTNLKELGFSVRCVRD